MKLWAKRGRDDVRDEELGAILRSAIGEVAGKADDEAMASAFRGRKARMRLVDTGPMRSRSNSARIAAAAAIVLSVSAVAGYSLVQKRNLAASSLEFAEWLIPERSAWVADALESDKPAASPTLELIELLWSDRPAF